MRIILHLFSASVLFFGLAECKSLWSGPTPATPDFKVSLCNDVEVSPIDPQTNQKVLDWAKGHLSQTGVLRSAEGFIYLKVDDRYINQLFPLLKLPPEYEKDKNSLGAHISVIYDSEGVMGKIEEIGKTYSFQLMGVGLVKTWCILEVKAPELMQLRQKYGLSPLLFGDQFHISIAKEYSSEKTAMGSIDPKLNLENEDYKVMSEW